MRVMKALPLRSVAVLISAIAMLGASPPSNAPTSSAAPPVRLSFVPHAALFSLLSRQSSLVDPEVYVASPSAPAALGFLQIAHVPGERNAEMNDDSGAQALDANARPLGFDLQHWFAANGVVQVNPPDIDHGNAQSVIVRFANLIPRGRYSVFVAHTEAKTMTMLPLDGSAKTNSFTADAEGNAGATVVSPEPLAHGASIVLVFHADRKDHGFKAGDLGFDAFDQLVVRIP
jgi:hypothetical protein